MVPVTALRSILLILLLLQINAVVAFGPSLRGHGSSPPSDLYVASSSSSSYSSSVSQTSERLLGLLIDNAKSKGISKEDAEIQSLMQELIDAGVQFDPRECLEGPLYAVAYQYGPTPFWIKYSKWNPSGKLNIEGQQFTSRIQDDDGDERYDAIAYGEFFGRAITVKVKGVCSQVDVSPLKDEVPAKVAQNPNIFDSLSSMFGSKSSSTALSAAKLKTCPADFVINVSNIQLCIFDKPIDLGIQGIGKLRVLFANPEFRIFYAPEDSTQGYEKTGLTVAQVRVDLLDPDFPQQLTV
jgi:hypothetical protein